MRVATLLTCHNRKYKTIACLSSLRGIDFNSDIYLVDDASTDGTSEAVHKEYMVMEICFGVGGCTRLGKKR